MMWWIPQPQENTTIEINPQELLNFIFQEARFLQEIETLLEKATEISSIFSGKSFFYTWQIFSALSRHFYEKIAYFAPKEVQE